MLEFRVWKKTRAGLMVLLTIGIVTPGGLGCSGWSPGQASASGLEPFIPDRVVTVRILMRDEDWTACQRNALAEQYVRADFWYDGELVPDVAVRPKGNSSLRSAAGSGSPRFSLKVDFNLFNASRSFRGLKKLNFNNGFSDPTLIRETLAYELFEEMGIPTPRTSFVDLWVNDTHLGVYTQVEQIDKTFLARHFPRNDGNLYKPEALAASLDWTEADVERQMTRMTADEQPRPDSGLDVNIGGGKLRDILEAFQQWGSPDSETIDSGPPQIPLPTPPREGLEQQPVLPQAVPADAQRAGQQRDYLQAMGLKTNENSPDHSALFRLLDILNNSPDETFPAEIEKVLDVDQVLRFLAVSALIVHLDNYLGMGHNYYLYEIDGRFTVLPWDLNMAFGTFNCSIDRDGLVHFLIDEPTCGPVAERPLVDRLLSHEPYLDAYHRYLEQLLDGPFSVERMNARIDELADLIRPFVENDKLKFFSTRDFERGLTEDMRRPAPPPDGTAGDTGREQAPQVPLPGPRLSAESLACVQNRLPWSALQELRTRPPTDEELRRLRSCLTRDELSAFLESLRRPVELQLPAAAAPSGPTAIGLKTFIAERSASVKDQLSGERPSAGDGSGNGGTLPFNRGALPQNQPAKGVER